MEEQSAFSREKAPLEVQAGKAMRIPPAGLFQARSGRQTSGFPEKSGSSFDIG